VKMTPRPLDLGPITTLTNLSRLPYAKMTFVWGIFALLLVAIFVVTHNFEWIRHGLGQAIGWARNLAR